jgi:hypothetical protein
LVYSEKYALDQPEQWFNSVKENPEPTKECKIISTLTRYRALGPAKEDFILQKLFQRPNF